MPPHLRALIVVVAVALIAFYIAAPLATATSSRAAYTARRNAWFAITLSAFTLTNIWLFVAASALVAYYYQSRESNIPALYFLLLFAFPLLPVEIPGLGIVNFLFDIHHARVLALAALLPAAIYVSTDGGTLKFGKSRPDKLLAAYMALLAVLYLRETTVTDTLRQCFYLFIDIFLPYYVISRALKTEAQLREALTAFVVSACVIAAIAAFEFLWHWPLYATLRNAMGLPVTMSSYTGRAGMLRAPATVGVIPLGYVMTVAIGFYLYLRQAVQPSVRRSLIVATLVVGLAVPLSRGPWLGAAVLILIYAALAPARWQQLGKIALIAAAAMATLAVVPGGGKLIALLPFIGSVETETISYREQLLTNSVAVISRHPLFGSPNYLSTPEMQEMIQGQGIIDIVNTYVGVALESGLAGLLLFAGFFVSVALQILRGLRVARHEAGLLWQAGRALLATLAAVLTIIFTVSSVSIIPVVYWSLAGLGVAYAQIVASRVPTDEPVTWERRSP